MRDIKKNFLEKFMKMSFSRKSVERVPTFEPLK